MNYKTIHLPQMFVLYLIVVAYGFPLAQSATSLWTVKSVFTFVVEGKVRLVAVGNLKGIVQDFGKFAYSRVK